MRRSKESGKRRLLDKNYRQQAIFNRIYPMKSIYLANSVAGFIMFGRLSTLFSSGLFAPLAAVVIAMVSISIGASIAKTLFSTIGPAGTTLLRLGIAAVILSLAFRIWRMRIDRHFLAVMIPYGLALGVMNLTFYMAIERIPLGVALAIEFTGPLGLSILFSRRPVDLLWIALAVAGLAVLLPLQGTHEALDPVGIAFAFTAGLCWAAYILTGKRAGGMLGAGAPAIGMIIGTVIALPFGIAEGGAALLDHRVLMVALCVALLSSAIPYSLEMVALRRLPAKTFSILTCGEPVVGAVMGMLILGESLPLIKWLGIALILAASVGVTRSARGSR